MEIRGVTQTFGGVVAVSNVTADVEAQARFGIIGPNGAGKTTLLNCISRVHRHYDGTIRIFDTNTVGLSADRVANLGVARTFQGADVFSEFTVRDFLMVGRHQQQELSLLRCIVASPRARRTEARERAIAERTAEDAGLGETLDRTLAELSYGARKLVDIVRAVATGARLLLLDEPTSGTASEDREKLHDVLQSLRNSGVTIVLVDHDVGFVSKLSDRLLVMDAGAVLAIGPTKEVLERPEVVEAYLGTGLESPVKPVVEGS